ncbi:MAG: hypothetical protein N2572_09140 [Syntrophales bacterium]|nr:hypothetical protein [Syntrophales bacterium]
MTRYNQLFFLESRLITILIYAATSYFFMPFESRAAGTELAGFERVPEIFDHQ